MISPYIGRLVCLSFACLFLTHLVLGAAACLAAPAAIRAAERMRPRRAAAFLLAFRLAPLACGAFLVAGLCIPSYLQLEPEMAAEPIGLGCLACAVLGFSGWAISLGRAARAVVRSLRYVRQCGRVAAATRIGGERAWIVDGAAPLVALAGLVRPRLVISRRVLRVLSHDELDAALRHERAHQKSRDNYKRLAVLLAPDLLPFARGFGGIEKAWARFSEWAADDRAVAGDPKLSLSLAAALVRVARLSSAALPSCIVSTLLGDRGDLSARVDRLLRAGAGADPADRGSRAVLPAAAAAAASCVTAVMLWPGLLLAVHRMLEHLVR